MSVESELFDSISQAACVNNRPINARKERQKTPRASGILAVGGVGVCIHMGRDTFTRSISASQTHHVL